MSGIKPPFTEETALKKVKAAQNLWNTQNPEKIAQAYTVSLVYLLASGCVVRLLHINRIFFTGEHALEEQGHLCQRT